ncbi:MULTISPECIES: LacI family DNA-binding transcriptional regulator [Pantoea]|uniref:LacI family DNA-binding transcriptional regulator n=1 Tax=Pantoea TaxID=53335 RepID=UPI0019119DF1|nr:MULTISPECIES: LacI family DNA-binding transcriptional regulator [Pantoea]MBK5016255.1 LacI family transcriptional regulator [Pantoea sp. S62]
MSKSDDQAEGGAGYRRVRLEDIAIRCRTSLSTVSRALSGEKGVSHELRTRIQDVARAMRYTPAQELGGAGIVLAISQVAMLDYHRYQFSWYVLQGLKARATLLGVDLITHPLNDNDNGALQALLEEPDVGGVLALTVDDSGFLDMLVNLQKPAVLVNTEDPLMRLSSVLPCNRSATRMACEYLLDRGHRDILFLTHPGRRPIEQREEGWREAMRCRQLICDDSRILTVTDWLPELAERAVIARFRDNPHECTAILCANDSLALGAMNGMRALGVRVPEEMSVMGMNNLPQAEFATPPLTTVHLSVQEIGTLALELLQDIIEGRMAIPRRVELACAIVERQSVARIG